MKISKLLTLDADLVEEFQRLGGNLSGTLNELLRTHMENNANFVRKSLEQLKIEEKDIKKKRKMLKMELSKALEREARARKIEKDSRERRFSGWRA